MPALLFLQVSTVLIEVLSSIGVSDTMWEDELRLGAQPRFGQCEMEPTISTSTTLIQIDISI